MIVGHRPDATGHCLCGAVSYGVSGPLREVIACHCKQCQRASGSYFMATSAVLDHIRIDDSRNTLRWFRDPEGDWAERGFCHRCGSNLFWRRDGADTVSITAGTLDAPTGLHLEKHIFVDHKGDYYTIDDSLPQYRENDFRG